jgi:hypothetical protein
MRSILVRSIVGLAAIAIVWLFGARQLSLLLDRFLTIQLKSLPVSPLSYSPDLLWIDGLPFELVTPRIPDRARLYIEPPDRVVVAVGGHVIALGSRIENAQKDLGVFSFAADPGDKASLTVERSAFSWPTPFEINFMTGHSPSWKRNLYYTLSWKKDSGSKLKMIWRFEQYYYETDGWASGMMTREGTTGLLRAEITQ